MQIGIIGFGRFGELLAKVLSRSSKVYVYDKADKKKKIKKHAIPASLEEVCSKELLILAIPISKLKNLLKRIKKHLKKDPEWEPGEEVSDDEWELFEEVRDKFLENEKEKEVEKDREESGKKDREDDDDDDEDPDWPYDDDDDDDDDE